LQKFQQGIDVQHEPGKLIEKIRENMTILENLAAEIFRHVSAQVKNTPLDMKVDPYAICLDVENKMELTGSEHENGLSVDPAITRDVEVMWFYKKKQLA